jgi:succinate dehydrogenase/fumarate reductase flavoprotein subunit
LAKVHEVENITDLLETVAMSSLFRQETRYFNIREDFPARDDKEWRKWVIIKKTGQELDVHAEEIPETFVGVDDIDF